MTTTRERAAEALAGVDPGRVHGRLPVGLRDGALLALLASGLSCAEVAGLSCHQVTIVARTRQALITARRSPWTRCELLLDLTCSARLVAWLSEIRGYGESRPLFFDDERRPLTRAGVSAILARHRRKRGGGSPSPGGGREGDGRGGQGVRSLRDAAAGPGGAA